MRLDLPRFTCPYFVILLLATALTPLPAQTTAPPSSHPSDSVSRPPANPTSVSTPPLDVRNFGAKCDGVADDTSAIQAAIIAAANARGGQVFLPPIGKCKANIVIDSVSGIELVGGAHYATSDRSANGAGLVAADPAKDVITIVANSADASNDAVRDLTIIGGHDAVRIVSHGRFQAKFGSIENLSIINPAQDGIRFEGNSSAENAVTWKWTVNQVHVYSAGANCFEQQGWVEQITYDDPYCGKFGHDAFLLQSVNNGNGPLSYETIIRSPSVGSYVGPGKGAAAGYDFEFINTEGAVVMNPYDDAGTANYAHLVGTYFADFSGTGHGGIRGENLGFVFDGVNVGTRIDLMNWRNSTGHPPLVNHSTSLVDLRLGFHGGGVGAGAAPFLPSDWEGTPPPNAYYLNYKKESDSSHSGCDLSINPCTRAAINLQNQSASIPETVAYVMKSEGQYRVCYVLYPQSGEHSPLAGQLFLTGASRNPDAVFPMSSANGMQACVVMHAKPSQTLKYSTTSSGSTYGLDISVEQLH